MRLHIATTSLLLLCLQQSSCLTFAVADRAGGKPYEKPFKPGMTVERVTMETVTRALRVEVVNGADQGVIFYPGGFLPKRENRGCLQPAGQEAVSDKIHVGPEEVLTKLDPRPHVAVGPNLLDFTELNPPEHFAVAIEAKQVRRFTGPLRKATVDREMRHLLLDGQYLFVRASNETVFRGPAFDIPPPAEMIRIPVLNRNNGLFVLRTAEGSDGLAGFGLVAGRPSPPAYSYFRLPDGVVCGRCEPEILGKEVTFSREPDSRYYLLLPLAIALDIVTAPLAVGGAILGGILGGVGVPKARCMIVLRPPAENFA